MRRRTRPEVISRKFVVLARNRIDGQGSGGRVGAQIRGSRHPQAQGRARRVELIPSTQGLTITAMSGGSKDDAPVWGPWSQVEYRAPRAIDEGRWSYRRLSARGGTIATGTNQVQQEIIGERVLGLPKG